MSKLGNADDIHAYLEQHRTKSPLRFIVCGSVGDGKSTLIDQVSAGSIADVAIILVDARDGIQPHTRRHSYLVNLLGIRKVVLAIDKMDLIDYSEVRFKRIEADYRELAQQIGMGEVTAIPLSALRGDNIVEASTQMRWYTGPTLMQFLETCEADATQAQLQPSREAPAETADQFECDLIWTAEAPMLPGRSYHLKIGAMLVNVTVTALKYRMNVDILERLAASELGLNEIGVCNISLDQPVPFESYANNRALGGFLVIDRLTNHTVGAGMLHFALRRSQNIHRQHIDIDSAARALQKQQKPAVLWFTGLSGAGKSTVANLVESKLFALGHHSYLLDGDNVRHGLNRDLGFTNADRVENIRRISEVAALMVDAGLIVLTAFISPFRADRVQARTTIGDGKFVEIYVDAPLETTESRDVKGLYKKARSGLLKNFTGIDSPYEVPAEPKVHLHTDTDSAEDCAQQVIEYLRGEGFI